MAEDLGNQLSVQQQINKVLAQRSALLAGQTKVLGAQVKIAAELCNALDCKQLEGMNDRLQEINESLRETADAANDAGDATEGMADAADSAGKGLGGFTKHLPKIGAAAGLFTGVKFAIGGIFTGLKMITKIIGNVIGSVFKLGMALLTAPIKILQGLVGMAQEGGGGGPSPVKLALEEIRKEMGSLTSNEGAALAKMNVSMRSQMGNLAGTGLSVARVFGRGRAGIAEAMKYNLETAKALGNAFSSLAAEFAKDGAAIAAFRKGLGLSAEQMAAVGKRALMTGKSFVNVATEIKSYADTMEKEFGYSSKLISRDMATLMEDFDHFGTLGPKALAQMSVQARRLGIEVKELGSLVDKWDDFEGAIKGASQLAQAFGMNIDGMAMMKEQDPSRRLDMMRQAFQATGRSVESMSRQELKLLATQSGLSMEATKMAFSQRGLGKSYDEVSKAGDKAKKKQLTQAQALSKLANTIERVFGSGGQRKFKGFFHAFTSGFGRGIKRSKAFRGIMRNIRRSLKHIYRAGVKVGRAFVRFFPGVKKLARGLKGIFDPRSFKKLGRGLVKNFTKLFKDLHTDPKGGLRTFLTNMKSLFKEFFVEKMPWLQMIKEGATKMLKAVTGLIANLIPYIKAGLIRAAEAMTEFIRDPSGFIAAARTGGGAAVQFIDEVFGPIWDALVANESSTSGVWGAFNTMFTTLWDKIGPGMMDAIKEFGEKWLWRSIQYIIIRIVTGAIVGALVKGVLNFMSGVRTPPVPPSAAPAGPAGFALFIANFKLLKTLTPGDIIGGTGKLFGLAGAVTVGMIPFALALVGLYYTVGQMKTEPLIKALSAMTVMIGSVLLTVKAAVAIAAAPEGMLTKAVPVIIISGTIAAALGALAVPLSLLYQYTNAIDLSVMGVTMTGMLALTGAVAFGAMTLGAMSGAATAMATSVPVIIASGLIVAGIGALAALLSNIPVNVENMKALSVFIPILFVTIGGVAWGAMALGAAIAASGGTAMAAMVPGILALGGVAVSVATITASFIAAFSGFPLSSLEKASVAATVAIKVMTAVAMATAMAMTSGLVAAFSSILGWLTGGRIDPFEQGMQAMAGTVETMAKFIPGMMRDMLNAVRGASAGQMEGAVNMLKGVMEAIQPMIDVQMAAIDMAGSFPDADVNELKDMFKEMSKFVAGPIGEVGKLFQLLETASAGMSPEKLKAAESISGFLSASASFIAAIMKPIISLISASKETFKMSTKDEDGNEVNIQSTTTNARKLQDMMDKLGEVLPKVLGAVTTTMDATIAAITSATWLDDPTKITKMEKFAKVAGPAFTAIGSLMSALMAAFSAMDPEKLGIRQELESRHQGSSQKTMILGVSRYMTEMTQSLYRFKVLMVGGDDQGVGTTGILSIVFDIMDALQDKLSSAEVQSKMAVIQRIGPSLTLIGTLVGDVLTLMSKTSRIFGAIPPETMKDSAKLQAHLTATGEAMKTLSADLGTTVSKIFEKMIDITKNLPANISGRAFKTKVERMKQLLSVVLPIQSMISAVSEVVKSASATPATLPAGTTAVQAALIGARSAGAGESTASKAAGFLSSIVEGIAGQEGALKKVFDLMLGKGTGANKVAGLLDHPALRTSGRRNVMKYKMARIIKMFEVVKQISGIVGEMAKAGIGASRASGGQGPALDPLKMKDVINAMMPAFGDSEETRGPKSPIGKLLLSVSALLESVPGIKDFPKVDLSGLTSMMSAIGELMGYEWLQGAEGRAKMSKLSEGLFELQKAPAAGTTGSVLASDFGVLFWLSKVRTQVGALTGGTGRGALTETSFNWVGTLMTAIKTIPAMSDMPNDAAITRLGTLADNLEDIASSVARAAAKAPSARRMTRFEKLGPGIKILMTALRGLPLMTTDETTKLPVQMRAVRKIAIAAAAAAAKAPTVGKMERLTTMGWGIKVVMDSFATAAWQTAATIIGRVPAVQALIGISAMTGAAADLAPTKAKTDNLKVMAEGLWRVMFLIKEMIDKGIMSPNRDLSWMKFRGAQVKDLTAEIKVAADNAPPNEGMTRLGHMSAQLKVMFGNFVETFWLKDSVATAMVTRIPMIMHIVTFMKPAADNAPSTTGMNALKVMAVGLKHMFENFLETSWLSNATALTIPKRIQMVYTVALWVKGAADAAPHSGLMIAIPNMAGDLKDAFKDFFETSWLSDATAENIPKRVKMLATVAGATKKAAEAAPAVADMNNLKNMTNVLDQVMLTFPTTAEVARRKDGMVAFETFVGSSTLALPTARLTAITNLLANMSTVEGVLKRAKAISAEASVIFKGGRLEVHHNLAKAEIDITVNLEAKKLVKEALQVTWNGHRVQTVTKDSTTPDGYNANKVVPGA